MRLRSLYLWASFGAYLLSAQNFPCFGNFPVSASNLFAPVLISQVYLFVFRCALLSWKLLEWYCESRSNKVFFVFFQQAEDVKCLLSDAMLAHTASHPPSVHLTPPSNGSSPASPNTSSTLPLSQANASLLANSPAGSGDGAVNKRSIAEAQGAGDTRTVFQGPYHKLKASCHVDFKVYPQNRAYSSRLRNISRIHREY